MNPLSRICGAGMVAVAYGLVTSSVALAQTELTVYTAVEAEDLKKYAERFNADHPDIEIKWVRDSTGIVTAKLLAEKDNPQADVVWGLAATSLMLLKSEGMLEPYAPAGVDQLDPKFVDEDSPPSWTGMDAWVAAICVNTVEAENNGLPMPASWQDLTKPEYQGHVAMPNPNSSGTGFLDVSSWLQMMGEDDGWAFMDGLHDNIAYYTHSGSKPCKDAARGEVPIGVSFAFRGAKSKAEGAPLEIIVPDRGHRLGHGSHGHRQGYGQRRGCPDPGRLVDHPAGQRDVQRGLCRDRHARAGQAGRAFSGWHSRSHDRQRLRLGCAESGAHSQGMAVPL